MTKYGTGEEELRNEMPLLLLKVDCEKENSWVWHKFWQPPERTPAALDDDSMPPERPKGRRRAGRAGKK